MWCVYLPFGLLLSALETIFFWYFLILDHLLIDDIFKVATRIKIKAGFRKNQFFQIVLQKCLLKILLIDLSGSLQRPPEAASKWY